MPPGKHTRVLVGIILSLMLAMVLRILPLPRFWFELSPDWMALLVLYWTLLAPERFGLLTAWLVGLLADTLTGRLLGQQALAYAVMAYLNLRARPRLLGLPLPLQCLWVLVLSLLGQMLILWTQRVELAEGATLIFWLPAFSGALAWPLVLWLMRGLRLGLADRP